MTDYEQLPKADLASRLRAGASPAWDYIFDLAARPNEAASAAFVQALIAVESDWCVWHQTMAAAVPKSQYIMTVQTAGERLAEWLEAGCKTRFHAPVQSISRG